MRVETIPFHSREYPAQLKELKSPPRQLWAVGDMSVLNAPLVAIVGTRRATPYGERMARAVSAGLTRAGACVVSGMALGIDGVAHRAALDQGGTTIAVLGTGADVPHPRANLALYADIVQRGLVLSEMPPGAHAHKGSFPNRNRIIAGLARLTIVVEAPVKSGALITAGAALDLDRDVAAVLGPIDSSQSEGSNLLVRDGAQMITSVDDAITLAGLSPQAKARPQFDDPGQVRVWNALGAPAPSLDDLCARANLPVAECLAAVTGLELRGAVECALTGEIRRR